jgi:glycosyltransferase involved in cell wall biosynthesis
MAGTSEGNVSGLDSTTRSPRVSVGMPVFNGEKYMAQALDSILAQTFQDFEIVISDNASTDHTEQICRSYVIRDPRIRYYRNEINCGAARNHNRVFALARGEYFKWQSHDDYCAPEFLAACVAVLDRDPEVVLCFPRTLIIDEENQPLSEYHVEPMTHTDSAHPHERFRGTICPNHWCFEVYGLSRRAVLSQTRLIASYTGSDRVLLAELALYGRFQEIPSCLFFNREHASRSFRVHSLYTAAGWFDPKLKGKMTFPHWRFLLEYSRAIGRCSRLTGMERWRCYAQLFPWVGRYWKHLAADFRRSGMTKLRSISPQSGALLSRAFHDGPRALLSQVSRVKHKNPDVVSDAD